MWKRCESTKVLGWIWKIVRTSGKILATPLARSTFDTLERFNLAQLLIYSDTLGV